MQFDRGYLSPYFVTDPERDGVRARGRRCILLHENARSASMKDLVPIPRAGREGRAAAADHRRGRRGRGARDAGGQQAPRRARLRRREGARLRRPPQGDARGHRDPDGRPGDRRGARREARERHARATSGVPSRVVDRRETTTTIIGGAGNKEAIEGRVEQIRQQIEETTSDYDREKLAGAARQAVRRRRRDPRGRAVRGGDEEPQGGASRTPSAPPRRRSPRGSCRAAGSALLRAIDAVEAEEAKCEGDERTGLRILAQALEAPTRQIAENSGVDGGVVVDRMRRGAGQLRLRRRAGRVRRSRRGGHHRPDQGRAGGTRERGLGGQRAAPDRGDADRGPRAEEGTGRRAAGIVVRSLRLSELRAIRDPAAGEPRR